jgi:hypothetical protein
MRIAPALVASFLLVVSAAAAADSPDAGGPQVVAAALQALQTAQKTVAEAAQRIEKEPPSNEDLEAAHVAVEALRTTLEAGTALEEQDLDYARAALAARKELRTRREYVEDRRAKVRIFDERRKIDAALAGLDQAAKATEPKDAAPAAYDAAHAAAKALEHELKEAQPFGKQDAKFAAYLAEADATLTRQQKAVDDRWTALALDKHRAQLQQALEALQAASGALNKGSDEAQADAVTKASAELARLLEAGKPFESRDKAYRADADRGRAEQAQAKKKMDEYMASVGLARLTADIEPARQSLVDAAKALRARSPTPEQLAEAKTAAFVVSKLLEKTQSRAESSPAFAQYLAETRTTLTEVEVQLQLRTLEASRKDVTQALRAIEKRSATPDDFKEAAAALHILEKTLETVHARDPMLQGPVADAKAQVRDAKATIERRRYQVDLQAALDKLRDALRSAEAAYRKIWDPKPEEALKAADDALKALDPVLDEGKPFTRQDADYRALDKKLRERAKDLTDRVALRRVQLAAASGSAKLKELTAAAKDALETAQKPEATDAEVDAGGKAVEALTAALEAGAKLERQDGGYGAAADRARDQLARLMETLQLARDARALRKLLTGSLTAGNAAVEAGGKSQDPNAQKDQYEKALRQFQSCNTDGASTLTEKPALAKILVFMDGNPNAPRELMALCAKRAETVQPLLDQVLVLAYFHNGPKRDYETAKAKLASGDKAGALALFNDCVADSRIFAQRYPKMKDEALEVSGGRITPSQLLDQCIKERTAQGGK